MVVGVGGLKTEQILFVRRLSSNRPLYQIGKVHESSYSEFHYRAICSFQESEPSAERQAHGNIYNAPGVCGRSEHLIKEFASLFKY